ncbi:MAG: hypothetical protein ACK55H_01020 [Cyanobacteriota bacterium]|jgi:hypothetical protein
MTRPQPAIHPRSVGWALLSQSIWLPLVAIHLHDRWKEQARLAAPPTAASLRMNEPGQPFQPLPEPKGPTASLPRIDPGVVLGSATRSVGTLIGGAIHPAGSPAALPQSSRSAGTLLATASDPAPAFSLATQSNRGSSGNFLSAAPFRNPLHGSFTRSELLGGTITLNDLQTPMMPPLAAAERARWANSSDPLEPLPQPWRDPMRKALKQLPGAHHSIDTARIVHVPSSRISRSTVVPLAIQSDGSVDILNRPENAAVVEEIEAWSSQQASPKKGRVAPTVVHLDPLPEPTVKAASAPTQAPLPSAAGLPSATLPAPAPAPAPAPSIAPTPAPSPAASLAPSPAPSPAPLETSSAIPATSP